MRYCMQASLRRITRVPIAMFFDFFFPLMMIAVFAGGNAGQTYGGMGFINYFLPTAIFMGLIPLAFLSFPLSVGKQIEDGSLERLNYFGVKTRTILSSQILAQIVFGIAGIAIDMLFSLASFRLSFPDPVHFFAFLLQILLGFLTLMAWGGVMTLIVKKPQALMSVGLIVMFFLLFCGGTFGPLSAFPAFVQDVSRAFPVSYASSKLPLVWTGQAFWCGKFLWISAIWLASGFALLFALSFSNKKLRENPFLRAR